MIAPLSPFGPSAACGRPVRVLHLEDSAIDQKLAAAVLRRSALVCEIAAVDTLDAFVAHWREQPVDVVIADYYLPGFTALDALRAVQAQPTDAHDQDAPHDGDPADSPDHTADAADSARPRPKSTLRPVGLKRHNAPETVTQASRVPPPFVLLSGAIGEAAAVEAMRLGMADYVLKDDIARLPHVLERALEVAHSRAREAAAQARLAASQRQLAALTEHLQQSIERERAAIAREIHDDIGGSLTAVKFELAWLLRHACDDAARDHARGALTMLEHALGASQRIMQNLRPPVLDAGLVAAVQWLAQDFERRQGVRVQFAARAAAGGADIAVNAAIQVVAYRTVQEALTNVAKYAQATQVWVDLADGEGALTVEVRDNGAGMSAATLAKVHAGQTDAGANNGFGLRGLMERARTAGGWLDVSSRPSRGTSVILTVPLSEASSAPSDEHG